MIQTYYIFFAAWSAPSPSSNEMWIYGLWASFTVVCTIVMFNVLIALVTEHYEKLQDNDVRIDTISKLKMVIEVCRFRVGIINGLGRCCCIKQESNFLDPNRK
jgi:hypothetical protein